MFLAAQADVAYLIDMLREDGSFKPKTKTVNIILMDGGLGDHVGSLVAVSYILLNYPWIKPLIWVPDYLLDLSKHLLPIDTFIFSYTQMKGRYEPTKPTKTTKWDGVTSPMKIHSVDYAFLKLCDENPSIEHKNYLQIKPDSIDISSFDFLKPKQYVVITAGYTAKVRAFPAKEINKITTFVKDNNYLPVFLGQTNTKTGSAHIIKGSFDSDIDYTDCCNLTDKTNLLEAAKIMHNAVAVLGVDNGLLHLAGCTQAPIIGGFTTVDPSIRLPIRNSILGDNYYPVVPDSSLGCRFCQQKTNFLYGHDYKECIYSDAICTEQMTAKKFIAHLKTILPQSS